MQAFELTGKVALITGASRGVGAALAEIMAQRGADIVINYRNKRARAEAVAERVRSHGRGALLAQADITSEAEMKRLFTEIKATFGNLDILVLNASGGLERDKPADYAMQLNKDAQEQALTLALPLMPEGGRVVFVTSHLAHFYGQKPGFPAYEPVAVSKQAGERALRARIPELSARSITFVVVSGDLIEGTITPKLLARGRPELIEARRQDAGSLPSVSEFAAVIADAAADPTLQSGRTLYVGSTD